MGTDSILLRSEPESWLSVFEMLKIKSWEPSCWWQKWHVLCAYIDTYTHVNA